MDDTFDLFKLKSQFPKKYGKNLFKVVKILNLDNICKFYPEDINI